MATSLSDLIISALMKRGVMFETRNLDITVDIPKQERGKEAFSNDRERPPIKMHVTAEHLSVRVTKGDEEDSGKLQLRKERT